MKTHIISGGHRTNSESLKIARFIKTQIEKRGGTATLTNLAHSTLPLWDEGVWAKEEKWQTLWNPIANEIRQADSIVVISPEYAGMAAPALKNFFLFCDAQMLAHKPALLVTVTSSMTNGAYPIQELRGSGYKNSHILYLPDHLIIRDVEKVMNSETVDASHPSDGWLRKKLDYCLNLLEAYEAAMKTVRSSGVITNEYPNGM